MPLPDDQFKPSVFLCLSNEETKCGRPCCQDQEFATCGARDPIPISTPTVPVIKVNTFTCSCGIYGENKVSLVSRV